MPFHRLIKDTRFANKLYSDWGVTYTTAAQLSSKLNCRHPDPGPRLRHRGYEHWPTSRNRGGGARWRRSEIFIPQSPGCHQGTSLAPVTAWHLLPCSGAFSALGHFGSTTRPRGRCGESPSRRDKRVRSRHAQTATAGLAGPRGAAVTASTASHGGHGGHSGPDWPHQHN